MQVDPRSNGFSAAVVYVVAVASITIAAQVTHEARFYLLALLLTLPAGIVAIVGVYVAYGLLVQVVGALSPGLSSDRVSDRTFAVTAPINVALFAAAAIANVLLLRWALKARGSARAG